MSQGPRNALQVESDFLAGAESNFDRAKGRQLRGTVWRTARQDEEGALRALLAQNRRHDRALLKQLPTNRRLCVHGFERRWLFGRRRTGMAIASVLARLDHLAAGGSEETMPPVDADELVQHVRKLVVDGKLPHVVGICSPSGFSDAARKVRAPMPNVTLVLVEPREGGGWRIGGAGEELPQQVLALFDPEDAAGKIARVKRAIEERSADLLVGGLGANSLAERLGLPLPLVTRVFEMMAEADPHLRVSRQSGEALLYRGAPASAREKSAMNVVDRIRALFAKPGDESQKINVLAERRAALAQRRDRLYEDIGQLEKKEAGLLEQGRGATSAVVRRRIASQIAQLRKDIVRQNTSANMLNSQINIISTDMHNLTLVQQGQAAKLPTADELTQNAVAAEEMLESLRSDVDLIESLETSAGLALSGEEELAVLKELEQEATVPTPPQVTRSGKASLPPADEEIAAIEQEFDQPAPVARRERSEPEAT